MNSAALPYNAHAYYESVAGGSSSAWNTSAASHHHIGAPHMWDYCSPHTHAPPDYYALRYENACHSTGTPSPHSLEGTAWPSPEYYSHIDSTNCYGYPPPKKRNTANKKERRRTVSINGAFSNLRDCIPNVPKDTKLSKIKTLRLAVGYMKYLMDVLNSDAGHPVKEFKADLSRKTERRADKRKCIEAEIAAAAERKARGRTGWPQTIWASDLKGEGPLSKFQSQMGEALTERLSDSAESSDSSPVETENSSCNSVVSTSATPPYSCENPSNERACL